MGYGRRRRGRRPDACSGGAQGEGQRGGRLRPGGEHARWQGTEARRCGHLHVRPDNRGYQHRCRRAPRSGGRADLRAGDLQAFDHCRPGDPYGGDHDRLGKNTAGLFSNSDELSGALSEAGTAVGEPVWRLPMGADYDRMIDSDIADMKNTGQRWAGSITAAQFLQRFVNEGVNWAHLDIAGTTWSDKDAPTVPKGATAFGVRLLDRYVSENLE